MIHIRVSFVRFVGKFEVKITEHKTVSSKKEKLYCDVLFFWDMVSFLLKRKNTFEYVNMEIKIMFFFNALKQKNNTIIGKLLYIIRFFI